MEGYKNLYAELEAKQPNGDYPREDNLRESRVQMKGRGCDRPWPGLYYFRPMAGICPINRTS